MEIKYMFNKRVYSISIGRVLPWFAQVSFISIVEIEHNDEMAVVYARHIWSS